MASVNKKTFVYFVIVVEESRLENRIEDECERKRQRECEKEIDHHFLKSEVTSLNVSYSIYDHIRNSKVNLWIFNNYKNYCRLINRLIVIVSTNQTVDIYSKMYHHRYNSQFLLLKKNSSCKTHKKT